MTILGLDNRTLLLVAGGLYVLLPLSIWLVLHMPRQRAPLLWCLGGTLGGLGIVLMGLRGSVPDALSYLVGQPMIALAAMMLAQSLRIDLGRPWPWWWLALATGVYAMVLGLLLPTASAQTLGVLIRSVNLVAVLTLAAVAWQVSRAESSRNALLISEAYNLQALAVLGNLVNSGLGSPDIQTLTTNNVNVFVSLFTLLVAVASAMGYLGLSLERSQRRRLMLAQEMSGTQQSNERRETLVRRDRERLLGLLADSLGHEIMQPLTAGLLRVQLGQRQLKAGASASELLPCIDDVIQNIQRARDTVERVRYFVRPLSSQLVPVPLVDLLREVSQLLRQEAINRNLHLDFELGPDEVWVMGDALQLSQAVIQVVRNAMEAVQNRPQRHVRVLLTRSTQDVQLQVSDTGPGLPTALRQLRMHASGSWPQSLQGIGLFVVHSILLRHRGRLELDNLVTGGACVTLVLPRHQTEGVGAPNET